MNFNGNSTGRKHNRTRPVLASSYLSLDSPRWETRTVKMITNLQWRRSLCIPTPWVLSKAELTFSVPDWRWGKRVTEQRHSSSSASVYLSSICLCSATHRCQPDSPTQAGCTLGLWAKIISSFPEFLLSHVLSKSQDKQRTHEPGFLLCHQPTPTSWHRELLLFMNV